MVSALVDCFYEEVFEVLNIFKFDLNDDEVNQIYLVLNHKDRSNSAFLSMFKEVFTQVVSTSDQKLIIQYFKEAFAGSTNLYEMGEKMYAWSKRNVKKHK